MKNKRQNEASILLILIVLIALVYYLMFGTFTKTVMMLITIIYTILCFTYIIKCVKYVYTKNIIKTLVVFVAIIAIFTCSFIVVSSDKGYVLTEDNKPFLLKDNLYTQIEGAVEGEVLNYEYPEKNSEIDMKIDAQVSKDIELHDNLERISFNKEKMVFDGYIYIVGSRYGIQSPEYTNIYKFDMDGNMIDVNRSLREDGFVRFLGVYDNELYFYNNYEIKVINKDFEISTKSKFYNEYIRKLRTDNWVLINGYIYTDVDFDDDYKILRKLDLEGNLVEKVDLKLHAIPYNLEGREVFYEILESDNDIYLYGSYYIDGNDPEQCEKYLKNCYEHIVFKITVYDSDLNYKKSIMLDSSNPHWIDKITDTNVNISEKDGQYYIYASNYYQEIRELGYDVYHNKEASHVVSDSIGIKDNSSIDNRFNSNITFTIITMLMMPFILFIFIRRLLYLSNRLEKYLDDKRSRSV